jgi:hypothetical protein
MGSSCCICEKNGLSFGFAAKIFTCMLEIPRLRVAKYSFRRILYIFHKDADISKPIGADTHVLDELIVDKNTVLLIT